MNFAHPIMLWGLLLIPILLGVSLLKKRGAIGSSLSAPSTWQRRGSILCRLLSVAALILALAGPILARPISREFVVAVVDVSRATSASDLDAIDQQIQTLMQSKSQVVVVPYAAQAQINRPGQAWAVGRLQSLRESLVATKAGSNLPAALALAGTVIPPQGIGRVELWTSGAATGSSDAPREAYYLAQRGIAINVHKVQPEVSTEVIVRTLEVPTSAGRGEKLAVRVLLEARQALAGALTVRQAEGKILDQKKLTLVPGLQAVDLLIPEVNAGLNKLRAEFTPGATFKVPLALQNVIYGRPALRLAVVEPNDDPSASTTKALGTLLGPAFEVQHLSAATLAETPNLNSYDLVIVADTPASQLTAPVQQALRQAVGQGKGVLFTGGPRSFGPGGYAASQLDDLLPVTMPQQNEKIDPSTTLVIIIDTSGSMGGTRISLAKETARLAIRRLGPHDKVGIVEFYGSKRWAAPIQSAANALDLNRALNRLTAGGGTLILPAIEEAGFAMRNVNTRTRHVVMLTDGGVESGPFEAIVRKMSEQGITVSSVLVGPGQHSPFLSSIAQWGHGHFYQVPDRFSIPELILKQPQTQLVPPFVEAPTAVSVAQPGLITGGLDFSQAPPVQGFVKTTIKPSADLLLKTASGDPLLARWNYGAGQVGILTTAVGTNWSAEFFKWSPAGTMLANLVRSMAGHAMEDALQVTAQVDGQHAELQVVARSGGAAEQAQPLEVQMTADGETTPRRWVVDPVTLGHWRLRVDNLGVGSYKLGLRTLARENAGLAGSGAIYVPEPRDAISFEPDVKLLDSLAAFQKPAAQRAQQMAQAGLRAQKFIELWPALTIAALGSFLMMLWLRRWPVQTQRPAVGEGDR